MLLSSARRAFLQTDAALELRVRQLSGARVLLCRDAPESCSDAGEGPGFRVAHVEGQPDLSPWTEFDR